MKMQMIMENNSIILHNRSDNILNGDDVIVTRRYHDVQDWEAFSANVLHFLVHQCHFHLRWNTLLREIVCTVSHRFFGDSGLKVTWVFWLEAC